MRPELPSLAEEIRAAIPEYARPMDGPYGQALRAGVHKALNSFVTLIANPQAPRDDLVAICRSLGKLEAQEGRTLDSLRAAYRIGARVAWQRVMARGPSAGLSSWVISQLADSIFQYIDELAAESRAGYLAEQARSADIRTEWRRRLLALIETLQALIDSGGNATEVASRLKLHPPTVRYRMRKAEQILGGSLTDPGARFGLELALRTRRLHDRPALSGPTCAGAGQGRAAQPGRRRRHRQRLR